MHVCIANQPMLLPCYPLGYGKRIEMDEFKVQKKGGKGITAIRFKLKAGGGGKLARSEGKGKSEADAVSCMRVCRAGDEVVLSTSKGNKNIDLTLTLILTVTSTNLTLTIISPVYL